ncbi:RNA polymerase sigma factor [Sorangium sp. So ce861]|uniref:RNA polymerase sigma factor n=1 Tax=Sorangium sp. So ce861 TaxID=3133323 RepID=UPI003F62914D
MREASEDELNRWMERLAQGERNAFDPLFRALYPRALRFARVRVGPERAADGAQSALERVFTRASEFTVGRPVLPWFYAVLANEVRAVARATQARAEEAPALLWSDAPHDPERLLVERELHQALDTAIASLDAPAAEAIGALLGRTTRPAIDAPAFRKRVSRAYARLRLLLGGSDGE